LDTNYIDFENIEFKPGETMIIDTDLLQVTIEDQIEISSITKTSDFFDLIPGDNEITIENDVNALLDVKTIWNNRWL
jgi:phage-related protein